MWKGKENSVEHIFLDFWHLNFHHSWMRRLIFFLRTTFSSDIDFRSTKKWANIQQWSNSVTSLSLLVTHSLILAAFASTCLASLRRILRCSSTWPSSRWITSRSLTAGIVGVVGVESDNGPHGDSASCCSMILSWKCKEEEKHFLMRGNLRQWWV